MLWVYPVTDRAAQVGKLSPFLLPQGQPEEDLGSGGSPFFGLPA